MSGEGGSPKSPQLGLRAIKSGPISAFDSQLGSPFFDGNNASHASLVLEKQPTASDLIQDSTIILDPATPRTPKHQACEMQLVAGPAANVLKRHLDAVVKVFCNHSRPNFELPWQMRQQTQSKSTGFAITRGDDSRCILTNAHSVTYSSRSSVLVKRRVDDERFSARVIAVGTECDVAMLAVDDEKFWKDIIPLELSDSLPELQDSVAVLGFPIGGESLAISAGVVSRVQMTHYSHGCMALLALQTDAAINSGNSGGPVLDIRGQCVGIAFQSLTGDSQSIGYVIPTSVVHHFLEDIRRHGRYSGFPSLNIGWQEMDSKALKSAWGLGSHDKGVLVRKVVEAAHESRVLLVDDVLLSIGGVQVGSDGTVPFRHGERVDLRFLITNRFVGEEVELEILRAGRKETVTLKLQSYQHLVPPHLSEAKPSFFCVGGLVWTALSDPYLSQRYGSLSNAPVRLLSKTYFGTKERPDQEVVVLSNILSCPATVGYDSVSGIRDSAIVKFNGEIVWSLIHLASMVGQCKEEYFRFDMEAGAKVIVMKSTMAEECTPLVVEDHNMNAAMSRDVEAALHTVHAHV